MTDAGAEFSEANYGTYLKTYDRLFAEEPDYSVAADAAAYARVEPELDALWSISETVAVAPLRSDRVSGAEAQARA